MNKVTSSELASHIEVQVENYFYALRLRQKKGMREYGNSELLAAGAAIDALLSLTGAPTNELRQRVQETQKAVFRRTKSGYLAYVAIQKILDDIDLSAEAERTRKRQAEIFRRTHRRATTPHVAFRTN